MGIPRQKGGISREIRRKRGNLLNRNTGRSGSKGIKGGFFRSKQRSGVPLSAVGRKIMPAELVSETLEKQAVEAEAMRRENEAVELLLKKADFDVPQSQVRRAMDGYLQELAQRAQYSGLDASYFEKNRDKILKDAEEAATKQVRLWYVLEAIAKAENIEAKDEERGKKVIDFVLANVKK